MAPAWAITAPSVAFFARQLLKDLRLVGGYEVLYPKVRDFMRDYLFSPAPVNLEDPVVLRNLSEPDAGKILYDADSPEARLWGRPTRDALQLARAASPLAYLSKSTPPCLIFHGDADTTIALEQSALFHAALQKAGARSEFITLPGVAHQRGTVWEKEKMRILQFFDPHLSP